jgi:hypothetical protein
VCLAAELFSGAPHITSALDAEMKRGGLKAGLNLSGLCLLCTDWPLWTFEFKPLVEFATLDFFRLYITLFLQFSTMWLNREHLFLRSLEGMLSILFPSLAEMLSSSWSGLWSLQETLVLHTSGLNRFQRMLFSSSLQPAWRELEFCWGGSWNLWGLTEVKGQGERDQEERHSGSGCVGPGHREKHCWAQEHCCHEETPSHVLDNVCAFSNLNSETNQLRKMGKGITILLRKPKLKSQERQHWLEGTHWEIHWNKIKNRWPRRLRLRWTFLGTREWPCRRDVRWSVHLAWNCGHVLSVFSRPWMLLSVFFF